MNNKLKTHLDKFFAPYVGLKNIKELQELKEELYSDLNEKMNDFLNSGNDEESSLEKTINTIGDVSELIKEIYDNSVSNQSLNIENQELTNFTASKLKESDFAGVTLHNGKFIASELSGSNFSGADLTGSSFKASNLSEVNFDGANLTDCTLSTINLSDASFVKSIFLRTNFSMTAMLGTKFKDIEMTDVNLNYTDLRKTIFENCTFKGVNFKDCNLQNLCLDGQTFIGVKFDNSALNEASFKGATLKNVSFHSAFTWHTWSKKYYRAIKTISFDGAIMDKLTYATLKSIDANLSNVILI